MSCLPQWGRLDQPPTSFDFPESQSVAFVRVGLEGRLTYVSQEACEQWGFFEGVKLPKSFRDALETQALPTGQIYQISVLALSLNALYLPESGWLIWEVPVAPNTSSILATLDAHLPMVLFRLRYDGKVLQAEHNHAAKQPNPFDRIKKGKQLLDFVHPEDRSKLTHALRELESGRNMSLGLRLQFPKQLENIRFVEVHLFNTEQKKVAEAVVFDMTQQSQVEEALLFNEGLYRSFLEQSPMGVMHLDETGVIVFENLRLRDLLGGTPESSYLGKTIFQIENLSDEAQSALRNLLEKGIAIVGTEMLLQQKSFLVHGSQIIHPEGHRIGATLFFEDQNFGKSDALQVNREERYKSAGYKLRDLLLGVEDEEDFLDQTLPILQEVSQAERIQVLLLRQGNQTLQLNAQYPPNDTPTPLHLIERNDFAALNFIDATPHVLHLRHGKALRPDEHRLLEFSGVHESVWFPFTEHGNPIGFFVFEKITPSTNVWTKIDVQLMEQLVASFENIWGRVNSEIRHQKTLAAIDESLFNFEFDDQNERHYTFFTPQVLQLTGYSVQELLMSGEVQIRWAEDLVFAEDLPLLKEHDRLLREGRQSYTIYRIRRKDGEVRWLKESANPHRDAAKRVTVGGILTDITEQKLAESALMEAKRGAESASETKTLFMATMSHELRTPLGAVSGFTDLLARELKGIEQQNNLPPQVGEFVNAIQQNAKRLLNLVNDLFDLSNLETGDLTIRHIPVALHTEIQRAIQNQQAVVQNKGLYMDLQLSENPLQVIGDPDRVRQILEKLIENAVKFTDKGGITISTGTQQQSAYIRVADSGVGMSEEYVANLFTPFMQEDRKMTRKYKGVGLGLALVKRLTDLMKGTIEVQSEKDKGSVFTVYLPTHLV